MLSSGSAAFKVCQCSHQRSPYCEDQSETQLILLLVAVRQSVISATSTSIITVAMFRPEIMQEKKDKGLLLRETEFLGK